VSKCKHRADYGGGAITHEQEEENNDKMFLTALLSHMIWNWKLVTESKQTKLPSNKTSNLQTSVSNIPDAPSLVVTDIL